MISVIVPVYNAEENLPRCLDSILKQTYTDFELLLMNDGSKDSSLAICKSYEEKDARIHVYSHENHGVSYTRNRGIELAQGEFIQFVDSDDYIVETMFALEMEQYQTTSCDLVICGNVELKKGTSENVLPRVSGQVYLKDMKTVYPEIFERFILNSVWNKLYVRKYIHQGFDVSNSLGEDLIFNLQYMYGIDSISFVKECLYIYDDSGAGLNSKFRENYIEIQKMLFVESKKFIESKDFGLLALQNISQIFSRFLMYGLADVYRLSHFSSQEKKDWVRHWVNNDNVQYALRLAHFDSLKFRLIHFLLKHKWVTCFDWIMKVKG